MTISLPRRGLTPPISLSGVLTAEGALEVPHQIVAQLGGGKRPAVRVLVNGVELRTTLAVYGGRSYVGLRREIREAAGVAPGESVELTVALDTEPRTITLPKDLAAALDTDPDARQIFDGLAYTHRKEYVNWVMAAKRPETRQRRLAETPKLLKRGRRTPL